MYRSFLKRWIDCTVSSCFLILLFPLLLLLVVLLCLSMRSVHLFFLQRRCGLKGKVFRIIKFRSMSDVTDVSGRLLPNEKRITRIGRLLRSTSLDELPQLINVLKGDMSLVGPRPLHVEYLSLYSKEQARRHEVRPGMTGWAQVNGRNAISWKEKFEYDVWYVDHYGCALDLRILCKTVAMVWSRKGVDDSQKRVGSEWFNGNN